MELVLPLRVAEAADGGVGDDEFGEAIRVHVAIKDPTYGLPPSLLSLGGRGERLVLGKPQHKLACARVWANEPVLPPAIPQ